MLGRVQLVDLMTKGTADVMWLTGMIGWYVIRYPYQRRARRAGVSKSFVDWREWAVLVALSLGLFVAPALIVATGCPAPLDRSFIPTIGWLGLVVLCAALWLFRRSHTDLGRNWSVSLKVRTTHTLVKTGVYRYIRHPMYSAFLLFALAQALLLSNWLADAVGLVAVGFLFISRISREENMMLDLFGEEYRSYMSVTTRIVPWIL
jgi:protein-S-isoprenylcysteine O-methyltransferase Ste14